MKIFLKILLSLVILASMLCACDSEDCISFSSNIVKIQFLDTATNSPKKESFQLITAAESQYYFYLDTTSSYYPLPINTAATSTLFLFLNNNNSIDSLVISYDIREQFLSKDCGFEILYKNLKISHSTFKKTKVLTEDLSILNDTDIQIYR